MEMSGEQRIAAPRERVWAALNDAETLQQCIPGCETLEKISDTQMRATAKIKVGPVTARFAGEVTLSDLEPPYGYRITGAGQGGVAGFARGGAIVRLEQDGDATILHYAVDAQVGGKLAQLGGRLIDATAQQMAGTFFKKFAAALTVDATAVKELDSQAPDKAAPGSARNLTSAVSARSRASWVAPAIAIAAIALLSSYLFTGGKALPLAASGVNDNGVVVLIMVLLSGAIGFLFGERAR